MKVQIKEPCSENFKAMPVHGLGRHCGLCQETVVDFTQMSPQEISDYLKQNPKSCGAFLPHQVIQNLPETQSIPVPKWLKYVPLGALGLSSIPLSAQEKPTKENTSEHIITETETINNPDCEKQEENPKEIRVISRGLVLKEVPHHPQVENSENDVMIEVKGTVLDSDGFPLADVEIICSNGEIALTDVDGQFTIKSKMGDSLTISEPLYHHETTEIVVNKEDLGEITLNNEINLTVGVIVIKRKFPHNIVHTLSYPYRKVRQWIRQF